MTEAAAAHPSPATTFDALELSEDVRKAITDMGYSTPTPVQAAVLDPIRRGKSIVVQARTGTGKTAAFGLPIIDSLIRKGQPELQALILVPTRELALQVAGELEKLGKYRGTKIAAVYGGASMERQVAELAGGAQIVVGTPGRVLDHLRRGTMAPKSIRIFVLDEADEMLSMGFAKELNAIIELLPKERQGLYFSATIAPDIERLANRHLRDPEYVTLSSDQIGALEISHYVYVLRGGLDRREALAKIIEVEDPESAVVFCNTRDETERLAEFLKRRGYDADWLNGDLEQRERERVMSKTREGKLRFLVATDVAARGIDISHLTHVINADFPENPESYVHRTGRTGRAGRTGTAISLVGPREVGSLYLLRLTYKIRPFEKDLPSAGDLKTREEADLVQFFVDAFGSRTPDAVDLAAARRLLTHDAAETVIANLLRDHLGARAPSQAAAVAAEARRAKNPAPALESAPTVAVPEPKVHDRPAPADRTRHTKPTLVSRPERAPVTLRDGEPPREGEAAPVERAAAVERPRDERPRDERSERRPRERGRRDRAVAPEGGFAMPSFTVEGGSDEAPAAAEPAERAPRVRDERPRDDDAGLGRIFVNVGRRDGAKPNELERIVLDLGAVGAGATLRVRVRDRHSFVSVPEDQVDQAIAALSGKSAFGRTLVAERARPGGDRPERDDA